MMQEPGKNSLTGLLVYFKKVPSFVDKGMEELELVHIHKVPDEVRSISKEEVIRTGPLFKEWDNANIWYISLN